MSHKKQIDRIVAYKEKYGEYPLIGVSAVSKRRAKELYKDGFCNKVVSVDEDNLSVTVASHLCSSSYSIRDNRYLWMPKNI